MNRNVLSKSLQTKIALRRLWSSCLRWLIKRHCGSQTDGCEQIRTSLSCQTVTEKISSDNVHTIPYVWFSDDKCLLLILQWTFRMITKLLCCKLHISSDVSQKKTHQLWNGVDKNYKDRFWWHLVEMFKIRQNRVCMLQYLCRFVFFINFSSFKQDTENNANFKNSRHTVSLCLSPWTHTRWLTRPKVGRGTSVCNYPHLGNSWQARPRRGGGHCGSSG